MPKHLSTRQHLFGLLEATEERVDETIFLLPALNFKFEDHGGMGPEVIVLNFG